MILGLWVCGLVMFNGCATTERQGVTVSKEDEMPVWINDPRSGLEEATIAGVGSDQAADGQSRGHSSPAQTSHGMVAGVDCQVAPAAECKH